MSYHNPAAFTRNFIKLTQQCVPLVQSKLLTPVKMRTVLPGGFAYESFNARGVLFPWAGVNIVGLVKTAGFYGLEQTYLDVSRMDCKVLGTLSSLKIEPEYNDSVTEKRPLTIDNDLIHVGKSSFTIRSTLYLPDVEHPVMEYDVRQVAVDLNSTHSIDLPEWWLKKYQKEIPQQLESLNVQGIETPSNGVTVHEDKLIVSSTDIDPNFDIFMGSYSKFCMEAYLNWHVKTYRFLKKGDPFRNAKLLQQTYKGVSKVGDVLTVKFWSSKENEDLFYFFIYKDSSLIHECAIEFYPLDYGE